MYIYPTRDIVTRFTKDYETILDRMRGLHQNGAWSASSNSEFKFSSAIIDNSLVIRGAVPGLSKKDLILNVVDSVLTITTKAESDDSFSKIEKHFNLPDDSDIDNITAVCKDGLLKITIPRITPEVISKTITIK